MFRRHALRALAAFALCLTASAGSAAADTATLRIATTPIDVGAEVYYAQDMGFFKKAGLDVQIQTISNGGAIAAAVASNAIDIGQGNVLSLITAFRRHIPITIVAPAGRYAAQRPTSQLLVTKNSPIRGAADLKGKTVATNGLKNILVLGVDAWVGENHGDPNDVKFLELPFSDMEGALAQGRVDAAFLAEPSLSAAKHTMRVAGDPFTAISPDFLIGAWFTSSSWAQAHPDLVKRFQAVMRETAAWANAHPAQSAQILAKYTKVSPDLLKTMARATYSPDTDPKQIQPVIDAAAKYGIIDGGFPAATMIYH
ncbi:MAG TPA: ABC transporter substrate-binding protein [Candidatus Limnocylindria bacterium]|nr:ABC transporter substrate-binding protein [Candidatus Limnocylindria bacterium]